MLKPVNWLGWLLLSLIAVTGLVSFGIIILWSLVELNVIRGNLLDPIIPWALLFGGTLLIVVLIVMTMGASLKRG